MSPDQLIYAIAQEGRLYDADTGHFCPTMHTISQPTVVPLSTFCFSTTGSRSCLTASSGLLSSSYQYPVSRCVVGWLGENWSLQQQSFVSYFFVSALYIIWSFFFESAYTDGLVGTDSEDMSRWTQNSLNIRHGGLKRHRVRLKEEGLFDSGKYNCVQPLMFICLGSRWELFLWSGWFDIRGLRNNCFEQYH